MLRDTEAFIEFLGYERVILCGMSMGSNNAYRYAPRHPGRLRALDVAPELITAGQQSIRAFRQDAETLVRFDDFLDRAIKFSPHRAPAHPRYSLMHALKQTDGGSTWKQDHRPRTQPEDSTVKRKIDELWDAVRAITTPTLLVRGELSQVLSEDSHQRTAQAAQDCETATITRATHNVQGDNPRDFATALDAWVVSRLGERR